MKVQIKEIEKLLLEILLKKGVGSDDAEILVHDYIEGDLQGKYSHGLMAFSALVKKLPIEQEDVEMIKKTEALIFVDAHKNFGTIVGRKVADQAIEMAKKQGVAIGLIKNMLSWLRPGSVAQYIAEQNMVGFVVNSGGNPMIAPPGGYEPRVGTNPIGIGVPMSDHNMIVDMATSKRAWGEVRKAKFNNTELPPETYFNNEGDFAVDPDDAVSVLPFGDYKGFALAMFIEILTGSLIDMPMNQHVAKNVDYRTLSRGAMILVINPEFSTTLAKFEKANADLAADIRTSKPRKGVDKVFIPGDRGAANKSRAEKEGVVEISDSLWKQLNELNENQT